MKKIFTTTAVLALGALITFACKKSNTSTTTTTTSTSTTGSNPPATMAASYTAGVYSGTSAAFTQSLTAVNQPYGSSTFGIQGTVMSGTVPITIYIDANIPGTGTIALNGAGVGNYAQLYAGPATSTATPVYSTGYPSSNPGTGTLNITTFNTTSHLISGTFSYTAGTPSGGMATITNGSFANVGY
ncbi:MAG TPA: hypothetical protein VNX01_10395 [Bacteroidia bacterium]|nr:hypothetical protein [Bacteroidia bacterium]